MATVSSRQLSRPVNQKLFRQCLPSHTSVNIPQDQLESIRFPSVARCARCGEDRLNLMMLKTVAERIATIRRIAALPGSACERIRYSRPRGLLTS